MCLRIREQVDGVRGPGRARVGRYLAGFGAGVGYCVHANTVKNLARGIVERVFFVQRGGGLEAPPSPKKNVFLKLTRLRNRIVRHAPPTPVVARDEYPLLYVGRKRMIYERAAASLVLKAITCRDAIVSTFVKAEKVNFTAKFDPAPRVIQPRTPRYNLEVGRYLKLFEASLCGAFKRLFGYAVIVKGMNASEVGNTLHQHWKSFREPCAVGLDASRFDQHVSVEALRWEHSVYNSVFRSPELARLLSWQIHNKGIARCEGQRVDYSVDGCRMSGDINTGLGNCLIMSSITIAYCEDNGIEFRLANNGDDCVLFIEKSELHRLSGLDRWFLDFGFTLTREEPVYVLEQVEFCQQRPVLTGNGYRMTRDPRTAMSKDCVSLLGWQTRQELREWAGAIGACGLSLTTGVPVWEPWYQRLADFGGSETASAGAQVRDSGLGFMAKGVSGCKVTPESRVSFWKAFGVLPDFQEALEADYSGPFDILGPVPMTLSQTSLLDKQNNPLARWRDHATVRIP